MSGSGRTAAAPAGVSTASAAASAAPSSVGSGADRDAFFRQGVRLILGRWTALQLAVENGWGGRQSHAKEIALGDQIVDWFYSTKDLYPDELENLLDRAMTDSFNTELDDGSIEQVADDLLNMYDDCRDCKFDRVLKLAASVGNRSALASSQRVKTGGSEDDDDDDDNDDEDDDNEKGENAMDVMEEDTARGSDGASAARGVGGEEMEVEVGGGAQRVASEADGQLGAAAGSQAGSIAGVPDAAGPGLTAEEVADGWETVPAKGKRKGKK